LASNARLTEQVLPALRRGQQWLLDHADRLYEVECTWLGKEVYSAIRVDSVYKLCAMLSSTLHLTHPKIAQPADISMLVQCGSD
jgi:hypothetical protein